LATKQNNDKMRTIREMINGFKTKKDPKMSP